MLPESVFLNLRQKTDTNHARDLKTIVFRILKMGQKSADRI